MTIYQEMRKYFLMDNGFIITPMSNLAYDKLKQDSATDEQIIKSMKKQGY